MRHTTQLVLILASAFTVTGLVDAQLTSQTQAASTQPAKNAPALPHAALLHGVAEPARKATISAPEEDVLVEISAREGTLVTKGDTLARLDSRVPLAMLEAAEVRARAVGAIERAQAELDSANRQLSRVELMRAERAAGVSELEDAQLAVQSAEASLKAAQEIRDEAKSDEQLQRTRLERRKITAPFDGVIARVSAETGEMMKVEDPILLLVDLTTLRVEFNLPVSMYAGARIGSVLTLHASAPADRTVQGTLAMVEPIIDPATRTFRCVVEVDNRELRLPAGFTATIDDKDIAALGSGTPLRIARP